MKGKLILIVVGIFSLFACDKEDGVESLNFEGSTFSLVGRWYTEKDAGKKESDMFAEYTFTTDGAVYIDEYWAINGYKRNEGHGTYTITDNKIISNLESKMVLSNLNGLELDSIKSLEFTTKTDERYGKMRFLRVIGMVQLRVGETDTISSNIQQAIAAYTSHPMGPISYEMSDEAVASIDETGILTAKLIGVTYLKVKTSIGTAVLKISVSDDTNLWNDFSKVLGKNFDEVRHLLGKHYAFSGDSIRYFYDNAYVDSVDIYRHEGIADSIIVTFHKDADPVAIKNYLREKLIVVDSLSGWYTNRKNYLLATFSARYHAENGKLEYTSFDPNWDDHIEDYGLTFDELKTKYGNYKSKDKIDTQVTYIIKNDFVDQITYFLNPNVYMYHIKVNFRIPVSMIENYLNVKFRYWDTSRPHVRNIQVDGTEMLLRVSVSNSYSLYYYFDENK